MRLEEISKCEKDEVAKQEANILKMAKIDNEDNTIVPLWEEYYWKGMEHALINPWILVELWIRLKDGSRRDITYKGRLLVGRLFVY